jgi:hypothetical protein
MKINFIKKILTVLALGTIIISCDVDDQVEESQLTPSSPTISVALGFTNPTLIENDTEYTYTVSLSTTQIVDVKLHISQIGGTASADDYEITESIVIPAGYLSATGNIKILTDDLIEDTETLQLQIGSNTTANATFTPVTTEFTILNYTDGDLTIDLSWLMPTKTTDDEGEEITPTSFADMVLLMSTTPDLEGAFDGADGGSFETYVLSGAEPDGDYYALALFYEANEDITRDLDLTLEFNQPGTINGDSYEFLAAISNDNICDNNFFVMTKIVKSGTSYTFEDVSINNFKNSQTSWPGGLDADEPSTVTTGVNCEGLAISNLNEGWMTGFWGEVIIDGGTVNWTDDGSGNITIANQFLYTTTYSGDVQPDYYVEGTGILDTVAGTLDITYELIQGTWHLNEDYGEADGFFHARLTLTP